MRTRLTEMLKIQYPIVQGGMQWVGRAELASAVSNAGGLGVLTALTQPNANALGEEIDRCRRMTTRPFGVNLTVLPTSNVPRYDEYLDVILDRDVPVLETAGSNLNAVIARAKAHGTIVIHKCTSVRHALSAQKQGVDAVSIDGFEAAGHPGEDDVGGFVLIRAAARKLDVPILASGGIADGAGMAAALALGAAGVNMGTRFCATREAPLHPNIKQALLAATERDTRLIFRTLRNTGRVLRNTVSEAVVALEGRPQGAQFPELQPLVAGARGRAALESGSVDDGLIWASQSVGLIEDLPTCTELIERMVTECRSAISKCTDALVAH
jgi:NADH:quinone reductase (non-electrogenic)